MHTLCSLKTHLTATFRRLTYPSDELCTTFCFRHYSIACKKVHDSSQLAIISDTRCKNPWRVLLNTQYTASCVPECNIWVGRSKLSYLVLHISKKSVNVLLTWKVKLLFIYFKKMAACSINLKCERKLSLYSLRKWDLLERKTSDLKELALFFGLHYLNQNSLDWKCSSVRI